MLFAIAARLHLPVTVVEEMSHRQVSGWIETFTEELRQDDLQASGAVDYKALSKAAKKAAFK
jgi:hypothetical protein